MDVFELAELHIAQQGVGCRLTFSSARLAVNTEMGSRLWSIDVNGIAQTDVLTRFWTSDDIRIELAAVTAGGRRFEGIGYLHPNVQHNAAAIRGDGVLAGY